MYTVGTLRNIPLLVVAIRARSLLGHPALYVLEYKENRASASMG